MPGDRDEFIPTRASLLKRLKSGDDQKSWDEFFSTYWKMLYGVAIRAGLSHAEAQDIAQDTIVAITKKMPDFNYDPAVGSFKSWLMLITRRRIIDHFRKRRREPIPMDNHRTQTLRTSALNRIPDPAGNGFDQAWEEEWQKNILAAAIARVKTKVSPRQFQLFDCSAIKGWPISQIAKQLKVTPGQIYTAKHRVGELVREEVTRLESARV